MENARAMPTTQGSKYLVLTAMIFAVAMMFIDQTIVSIAVPAIDKDLQLTGTGAQWIINGYLLALAALFALGGKLSDVVGHRTMVLIGIAGFAIASALCGAAPSSGAGEAWLIGFRIVQGAFGAILFPSALAIAAASFDVHERGKALALFFGITGALTSVGPLAGGFLIEWTWRAIFWINIPVALIALALTLRARPAEDKRVVPIDARGAILVSAGMGLGVLGLQQASVWGWGSVATLACLIVGGAILVGFVSYELRTEDPLIEMRIFEDRGFAADNMVLFLLCVCFVPLFFFASVYAQAVLRDTAAQTGLYLLVFFLGFASASQIGGRILDARGARPAVIAGCAIATFAFRWWASKLGDTSLHDQWPAIVVTGAGLGLVLSPVSTDALNRAPRGSYGEVTGVTQTVRYFASSLGLALLGTVFLDRAPAHGVAAATATVYRGMGGVMAAALVVSLVFMKGGRVTDEAAAPAPPAGPQPA
jgi:EmrB/QacA subfamily drug resistance transporter